MHQQSELLQNGNTDLVEYRQGRIQGGAKGADAPYKVSAPPPPWISQSSEQWKQARNTEAIFQLLEALCDNPVSKRY